MKFKNVFKVLGILLLLMFTLNISVYSEGDLLTINFVSSMGDSVPLDMDPVTIQNESNFALPNCNYSSYEYYMTGWSHTKNGDPYRNDVLEGDDYRMQVDNHTFNLYANFDTLKILEQPNSDNNFTVKSNVSKFDSNNYDKLTYQWYKVDDVIDISTNYDGEAKLLNKGDDETRPIFKDSEGKYMIEAVNKTYTFTDFADGIAPLSDGFSSSFISLYVISEELSYDDAYLLTFNKEPDNKSSLSLVSENTYRYENSMAIENYGNYNYRYISFSTNDPDLKLTNVKVEKRTLLTEETSASLKTREAGKYCCKVKTDAHRILSDIIELRNLEITYDDYELIQKLLAEESLTSLTITPESNPIITTTSTIINEHASLGKNYPEDRGYTIVQHKLIFNNEAERRKVATIKINGRDITNFLDTTYYDKDGEKYHALLDNPNRTIWYPDENNIFILFVYNTAFNIDISSPNLEIGKDIADLLTTIEMDADILNGTSSTFVLADGDNVLTNGKLEANKEYTLSFLITSINNTMHDRYLNYMGLVLPNTAPNDYLELYYTSNIVNNDGFNSQQHQLSGSIRFTLIPRSSGGTKKYSTKEVNKEIAIDASTGQKKEEAVISGSGKKGSTMTISLPENRRVLEVLVTDLKGNNIELNKEDDKTYSFVQPASNVNVDIKYINKEITLNLNNTEADVDGEKKVIDVMPQIKNDRTMVPLRFIMETLGLNVEWLPEDPDIVRYKNADGTTTVINLATGQAFLEGKEVELDAKPYVEKDRTMVPVRFISESAGCEVRWSEKKPNEVKIYEVE